VDDGAGEGAVDIWVNLVTTQGAAQFLGQEEYANVAGYLGGDGHKGGASTTCSSAWTAPAWPPASSPPVSTGPA